MARKKKANTIESLLNTNTVEEQTPSHFTFKLFYYWQLGDNISSIFSTEYITDNEYITVNEAQNYLDNYLQDKLKWKQRWRPVLAEIDKI